MLTKVCFSIRFFAILMMFALLISGCENEDDIIPITVEDLNGSWVGSFDCNGLDNGDESILCGNIKLNFLNSKYFTIEIKTKSINSQFETISIGEYSIDNDKLLLVQDECIGNDPDCLIVQKINGNNIRLNLNAGGFNIIFPKGIYFYEKIY